tara:strand:- start:11449 stop:11610 length:162 start_codon:yes stop_codon:yes gene_type:complete
VLWRHLDGGRVQGDLSAGNLKATRRQARRFARTGMKCPEAGEFQIGENCLAQT